LINKPYGDLLYNLLPTIYRKEDANRTDLQRFLQVNGVGLDFLKGKTEGYSNLFNLDYAPAELLPEIAKMMGFDYPYDMSEQEQRSLLKVLPTLYKIKGTKSVFNYLAQQIFGFDATASVDWVSRGGLNGENLITLNVSADGEKTYLQTRIDRYSKYSEQFRPVNHKLFYDINLFYADTYDRQTKIVEDYDVEQIFINDDYDPYENFFLNHLILGNTTYSFPQLQGDIYDRSKISETYTDSILLDDKEEVYNKSGIVEELSTEIINYTDVDSYAKNFADTVTDAKTDLTYALNMGRLNSTMQLSKSPIVTTNTY
jgi:phage tail-like protein